MIASINIRILLVVFSALIYAGCAAPKITNHSKGKFEYRIVNSVNFIDVTVTRLHTAKTEVVSTPPILEKTFFDLRDSIPQAFLKVIGDKATSVDEIIKAIRTPLITPYPTQNMIHQKVIDQRYLTTKLLFSNVKKYYVSSEFMHPNTRLDFLNTQIKLDSQSIAKLVSVDRMENEFEVVDLGTLNNTSEGVFKTGLSGNLGYTGNKELNYGLTDNTGNTVFDGTSNSLYDNAGNMVGTGQLSNNNTQGTIRNSSGKETVELGAGAKADIGYELKNSLTESVAIKQRRLKTGISFDTAQLTISQRGSP